MQDDIDIDIDAILSDVDVLRSELRSIGETRRGSLVVSYVLLGTFVNIIDARIRIRMSTTTQNTRYDFVMPLDILVIMYVHHWLSNGQ